MIHPITRTKEAIQRNRQKIVFTSGALTGAAIVVGIVALKKTDGTILIAGTSDLLKQLIDEPTGAIRWGLENGTKVVLINSANPELT